MKALVHLGMPKTGTTAIQTWLSENQTQLRAQGVGYDRASAALKPKRSAHAELSLCVAEKADKLIENKSLRLLYDVHDRESQRAFVNDYENLFAKKVASIKAEKVVLSSEYLGAGLKSPSRVLALTEWLKPYFEEVQYIIYFRRQEDLVLSGYSQRLKGGYSKDFDDFFQSAAKLNFASIVRRWHNVVDPHDMDVRLFERDWMVGGDAIDDFAHAIGADVQNTKRPAFSNESLGLAAQHLLRAINETVPHTVNAGKKFNLEKADLRKAIMHHPNGGSKRVLSEAQVNHIRLMNEEGNAELREMCFPERAELFPPRDKPTQQPDTDTAANVAKMAADIIAERLEQSGSGASTVAGRKKRLLNWGRSQLGE